MRGQSSDILWAACILGAGCCLGCGGVESDERDLATATYSVSEGSPTAQTADELPDCEEAPDDPDCVEVIYVTGSVPPDLETHSGPVPPPFEQPLPNGVKPDRHTAGAQSRARRCEGCANRFNTAKEDTKRALADCYADRFDQAVNKCQAGVNRRNQMVTPPTAVTVCCAAQLSWSFLGGKFSVDSGGPPDDADIPFPVNPMLPFGCKRVDHGSTPPPNFPDCGGRWWYDPDRCIESYTEDLPAEKWLLVAKLVLNKLAEASASHSQGQPGTSGSFKSCSDAFDRARDAAFDALQKCRRKNQCGTQSVASAPGQANS